MNPDSVKHITGGSAFPYIDPNLGGVGEGVSVRDYFAAKAMQGLVAQSCGTAAMSDPAHGAKYAYEMADAMMEARK